MQDMEAVFNALKIASEYGLQVEVVMYALIAMKQDPTLSVAEAINISLNDWVK